MDAAKSFPEKNNILAPYDLRFLLSAFLRKRGIARLKNLKLPLWPGEEWEYQHTRFWDKVKIAGQALRIGEQKFTKPFPFTAKDAPRKPAEIVALGIGVMAYLVKVHPDKCTVDILNQYLLFCESWQLPSFKTVFRQHFDHGALTATTKDQLRGKTAQWIEPEDWCHPLPLTPHMPSILLDASRSPNKATFLSAMNVAHTRTDYELAKEVWGKRQAWLARLHAVANERRNNLGDTDTAPDLDLLKSERSVTGEFRGWIAREYALGHTTGGSSFTLYEGYIRLRYIEILAKCRQWPTAFKLIREGTGEKYPWDSAMLADVRESAMHQNVVGVVKYIDSLEDSQQPVGNREKWYGAAVDDMVMKYEGILD
jgi:hypothetical protein